MILKSLDSAFGIITPSMYARRMLNRSRFPAQGWARKRLAQDTIRELDAYLNQPSAPSASPRETKPTL